MAVRVSFSNSVLISALCTDDGCVVGTTETTSPLAQAVNAMTIEIVSIEAMNSRPYYLLNKTYLF